MNATFLERQFTSENDMFIWNVKDLVSTSRTTTPRCCSKW